MIAIPVPEPLQMAWEDCNDLGNAERLKKLSRGLLLWVVSDGGDVGWFAYDGKRWSHRDGELRANQLAHDVVRHIDREAAALNAILEDRDALEAAIPFLPSAEARHKLADERVTSLRKHAVTSGNANKIAGMLKEAKTLMAARLEDFDQDPLAFNCRNGTLRFIPVKGGGWEARLDGHEPADRLMQLAAVDYDPQADCPDWKERLRLIQAMKDQRVLLQQRYGYCMTGLTSEQKWFIDQGQGSDGKSLTNRVIAKLWGDYYRHADIATFLQTQLRSGADHSADMERLAGDIRLVVSDEPPQNATWNGSRLKQITGSEVTARGSGAKRAIDFEPRFKLIVEVNPLPKVPNDDHGFWRRVVPIPWSYQFDTKGMQAAEPFDLLVHRYVDKEGSGILNWAIAGALKWLETRRLPMSDLAAEFLDNYKQSASPYGEWLGDRCDIGDRAVLTPSGDLYRDFKQWCETRELEKVPTQTAFGRFLTARQYMEKKDGRGNRFRRGIRLRDDWTSATGAGAAPAPAAEPSGVGGRATARPIGPQDDVDWGDAPP